MEYKKPTVFIVLDGLGYCKDAQHNAVAQAHMQTYEGWLAHYPHALLAASGASVGLPEGTPGNSLVGHLTLGTGRIIPQPITALHTLIDNGLLCDHPVLAQRFDQLAASGGTLQIMGLVSDGASHSHEKHLHALLRCAHQRGIKRIVVHAFLDGRDVLPRSAELYLERLEKVFAEIGCGCIGSLHGRAYPMDRNGRQEFIEKSFRVLTQPSPVVYASWQEALQKEYAKGLRDEFIQPTALVADAYVHDGDGLIFFNVRADRARSMTHLFYEADKRPHLLWMITGIRYYPECLADILYEWPPVTDSLLDVLEQAHKTLFVIAEKEKYAHVTYFFSGGREVVRSRETRVIVPSLPMEQFEQHPQLSAVEITTQVVRSLETKPCDFYLINYANSDMLGHTGNLAAAIKALQCIDEQLRCLYDQVVEKMNGTLFVVSDHGNAEDMFDEATQQPKTGHTTNPVWFMMIAKQYKNGHEILDMHELADVAPFILKQMGLAVPGGMKKDQK